MNFLIFKQENGDCPYSKQQQWITHFFYADHLDPEIYERMITQGWRRNSFVFYQNQCDNCSECIPIRINVESFSPSKSQRKILRKNSDLTMTVGETEFNPEDLALFNKYSVEWHQSEPMTKENYLNFIYSPIPTLMERFFLDGKLVGIGWIDVLKQSLSSVYFAFDPEYADRQLGTFSILKEMELCQQKQKKWLQLGFLVSHCQKMSYKSSFKPYEIAIDNKWVEQ